MLVLETSALSQTWRHPYNSGSLLISLLQELDNPFRCFFISGGAEVDAIAQQALQLIIHLQGFGLGMMPGVGLIGRRRPLQPDVDVLVGVEQADDLLVKLG